MQRLVLLGGCVLALVFPGSFTLGADEGLVAWWKFDAEQGRLVTDAASGNKDQINGNFDYVTGAVGNCLKFDGYTTHIVREAAESPFLVDAFTIEAWIAPQTYSWNRTGIVDQAGPEVGEEPMPTDVSQMQLEPGLIGAEFLEADFENPSGTMLLESVEHNWTGGYNDWSGRWRGYIEAPYTGEVTFTAEVDNGIKLEIDKKVVIDGLGRGKGRSGGMEMVKGRKYPIVLSYFQDGDPSYMRLYWSWGSGQRRIVEGSAFWHSQADVKYVKSRELNRKGPAKQREYRLFFGIDSTGHIGMKLMVNGKLVECASETTVPLLRWSHIAGTFDKNKGIELYIDGKPAGSLAVKGVLTPARGHDLVIGKGQRKMSPVGSERGPSRKLLSDMVFDGLIDEVKVYDRRLSGEQIRRAFGSARPAESQPLDWRVMPSGPKELPARFCATYCRLRYADEWEKLWRVGPHPDILVRFDRTAVRLVFWRGTAYGAVWVAENGKWMGDQSLEATGNSTGWGCSEHMSDKQCRYSRVRIIENHDARIVVHWQYAVSDIVYGISRVDKDGWGEWADEYYYIYPDAVSTREQILHSTRLKHEWQETIVLHQPGTFPEDNIELEALTLANMDGESRSYSWEERPGGGGQRPEEPTIQITNLKAENRPFLIFEPNSGIKFFTCCVEDKSHFSWWNHWPVGQLPNDGRRTKVPDRPAHSSLSQSIEDSPVIRHDKEESTYTAVHLTGMSSKSAAQLVPLARSWNYPPELKLAAAGPENKGYDKYQRAYVLRCNDSGNPSEVKFELAAGEKSPLVNPCFVLEEWGAGDVSLKINGVPVKRGGQFRFGHKHRIDGSDLVVWLELESTTPVTIAFSQPDGGCS